MSKATRSPADRALSHYADGGAPDWRSDMDKSGPGYDPRRGEVRGEKRPSVLREPARGEDPTLPIGERLLEGLLDYGPLPAQLAVEATGAPTVLRGVENIRRGIDEGDTLRGVGGVGQVALGALPGAGLMRGPIGAAANALMPSVPAAIATTTALGLPIAYADSAEAGSRKASKAIDVHPDVVRLREALAAAELPLKGSIEPPEIEGLRTDLAATEQAIADASKLKYRSAQARELALAPLIAKQKALLDQFGKARDQARTSGMSERSSRIETLRKQLVDAEKAAGADYMENAPFRERYPGAAELILGGGLATAFGSGAAKGAAKALGDRIAGGKLDRATDEADRSISALTRGLEGSSAHEAASAQELLRGRLGSWDRRNSLPEKMHQGIGNLTKGAVVGTEASALPEQIDYVTFEPGHPTRENAAELFKRPGYWAERAVPAASGAAAAWSGAALGKGAANTLTGGYKPDLDKARMTASWGDEPSTGQRIAARLFGSEPKGASDLALDRVLRHQEAVARAEAPTLKAVDTTRQAQSAGRELSGFRDQSDLGTAEAQRRLSAPGGASGLSEAAQPLRPSPSPEASSSPASSPPAISSSNDIPLPPGLARNSRGVVYDTHTGQVVKKRFLTERAPKKGSKPKSSPIDEGEGFAMGGGVMRRALDVARKFANGGVVTGPVIGETGGREDAKPVDVAAGSYVIPADCVSALGEGNSMAGHQHLNKVFGEAATRAAGGAIPILISDGEHVLTPEQVEKIGGGDMKRGHQVLDALVKKVRAAHIETLKSLPGPAKGHE